MGTGRRLTKNQNYTRRETKETKPTGEDAEKRNTKIFTTEAREGEE